MKAEKRRVPWGQGLMVAGGAAALTLLLLVLAGVFTRKVPPTEIAHRATLDPQVEFATVKPVRVVRSETAVGSIRAVHEAAVASKLLARVLEVRVKAGQAVREGEILVVLDDADLKARVKQLEATLTASRATLDRAVSDQDRARQLFEKAAIARAEFDQSVANLKTAQAELQRAQQALAEAQVLFDYATVRAPLTGLVIDKHVEPGDTASPGQVLVNLYEPDRMQMVATVRESLALRLKVGDRLPARLDALGHECLATVSEIVPQAESNSRSFTVKVTGPCPPGVYSGMFGRIFIPLDTEELLLVPSAAIRHVGQLDMVDVVAGDTADRRVVRLGKQHERGWEVLAGLQSGDKVVLQPQPKESQP